MEAPNSSSSVTQQLIQATYSGLSRPLNPSEIELLSTLERLKHFLATAPSRWSSSSSSAASTSYGQGQQQQQASTHSSTLASLTTAPSHPALNRFLLPSGEYISCVLWSGLYHITGTDIVRALVYRFEAFGRPVTNMKKFEEGVFSDLRNLKPGTDACLEEPKSPFLDLLFKYQCIRTQKKQKVFYWFSVPHDRLFLDALERDLKREKMGLESTTTPRGEPAISFKYDPKKTLYEQFLKPIASSGNGGDADEEDELNSVTSPTGAFFARVPGSALSVISPADIMARKLQAGSTVKQEEGDSASSNASAKNNGSASASSANKQIFTNMFSLFEGSPTYKQRRKKAAPPSKLNPEISRRRSTLASEVAAASLSRRSSNAALGEPSVAGAFAQQQKVGNIQTHPSLVNNQRSDNMSPASGSRPQSQHASLHHGQEQQLPSYGLSMNLSIERPATASTNDQRPITANSDALEYQSRGQETTKAFVCPLYSCRRLFHRPEALRKHLSTHAMSAIIRSRASSLNTGPMGPGLKYPCDKPGCFKVFTRPDNLRLHQQSCNGWSGAPNSGMEDDSSERAEGEAGADPMDLEADIQEIEVPANATFEDEEAAIHASSVSPPPPGSSHGHLNLNLSQLRASQFGVATTSAETSPFVETPDPHSHATATPGWNAAHPHQHRPADLYTNERAYPDPLTGLAALNGPHLGPGMAQYAALHNGIGHHTLHHHMSHHNLGLHPSTPPPDSASSIRSGAVFGAQQNLHPRFHTPEYNAYAAAGYGHPSSAPSHKVTFDHASLYPPNPHNPHNGGMVGLSLRRHRSAAPTLSGGNVGGLRNAMDHPGLVHHQNLDSRPASSAGGDSNYEYGTVIVNPAAHGQQFAYQVEGGEANAMAYGPSGSVMYAAGGPGSDHSSPMSYGRVASGQGEYGDSNSPYDGSGASPGSAHNSEPHLAHAPLPQQAAYVGMRIHHGHSLSSEIATQQMQQYVDLDGLADDGDSYHPPPTGSTSYHSHTQSTATIQGQPTGTGTFQEATSLKYHDDGSDQNHSTTYMDVTYRSGGSESSHEDVYGYNQHPHDPQSIYTQTHQLDGYGYPSAAGQQIAL